MVLIFRSWPLLNTMTTYGILWTASDITQELVVSRKKHVDWRKTGRIATTGAFFIAPLIHTWIHVAELLFPGKSMKMVLKKVVWEQICFSPIALSTFYVATSAMERKPVVPELKAKLPKAYMTALMFWPVVQVFNFRMVPQHYKPVVVASASFVWSIFLCFTKENVSRPPDDKLKTVSPSLTR